MGHKINYFSSKKQFYTSEFLAVYVKITLTEEKLRKNMGSYESGAVSFSRIE